MTWKNGKLDREYLEHVQRTDYGAAITDEMIDEILKNEKDAKIFRKLQANHMHIDLGLLTENEEIVKKIREHYIGTPDHIADCSTCAYLKPIMEGNK